MKKEILDFEKLLIPISEEKPSGVDISDETDFYMLEEIAKGKQETQFSEAETPKWNEVLDLALILFSQSKDLWVAYHILCGAANIYGDEGMSGGLLFLQKLLEGYWDKLYPNLDNELDEPAQQRINIVKDIFTIYGPFVTGVRNIKLSQSRLGDFSYRDIQIANKEILPDKDKKAEVLNTILAAIKDSSKEFQTKVKNNFSTARDIAASLKKFLGNKGISSDCEKAIDDFISMIDKIEKYVTLTIISENVEGKASQEGKTGSTDMGLPGKNSVSMGISGHQDITRMLEKICQWYEENEPSSPVPLFLKRANSMIGKGFIDIVRDVASSAMNEVSMLFKVEQKRPEENKVANNMPMPKKQPAYPYSSNYGAGSATGTPYNSPGGYQAAAGYSANQFGASPAGEISPDAMPLYPGGR